MTKLLQKAIQEVKKLPQSEQDTIASLILDEIADEKQWDETFAKTQLQLAKLAKKVRLDIKSGKTKEMGIDGL
jgi:hypothetical protein